MSSKKPSDRRRNRKDVGNIRVQLDRIYARDKGICQLCKQPCSREEASREHLKEVRYCTKEEARSDDNIVLAHKRCNFARADRANKIQARLARGLKYSVGDVLSATVIEKLRKLHESN